MSRAISYVRWSSKKQSLGDSAKRQLRMTLAFCERNALILDDTLRLTDEGVSAYRSRNNVEGNLGLFLAMIQTGDVKEGDTLIVESIDRLSRDKVPVALSLFLQIIASGVRIVTLDPERIHTRETINEPIGLIEPILIMCRANEESNIKSSRTKSYQDANRALARSGKPRKGKMPWWLQIVDGKYVPIPENAKAIQRLFDLKEQGYPRGLLLKTLNDDPAIVKPPRLKAWCRATLYKLLRERQVLGEYQPCKVVEGKRIADGEVLPKYYPAIIDPAQWHRVNGMHAGKAKGRAPARNNVNIFSHILADMRDDSPMHMTVLNPKNPRTYLIANSTVNQQSGNAGTMIRYDVVERVVLRHFQGIDPRRFKRQEDGGNLLLKAQGEHAETLHRIKEVKERYKAKGGTSLLELLGDLEETAKQQADIVDRLETQLRTHASDQLTQMHNLIQVLDGETEENRRDLRLRIKSSLRTLVRRIKLHLTKDGHKGRYNRLHFRCTLDIELFDGSNQYVSFDQDGMLVGHGDSERYTPRDRYEDFADMASEQGITDAGARWVADGLGPVPPPRKEGEKRNTMRDRIAD